MKVKKKKGKPRPFLTGRPDIDYQRKWHEYDPVEITEEEAANNETYYRMQHEDAYKAVSRLWPCSSARYEDCVNFEKAHPGRYWDQDMLAFARWVTAWRKKQGIHERDPKGPTDEFLNAMKSVYPGRALPVIMNFRY